MGKRPPTEAASRVQHQLVGWKSSRAMPCCPGRWRYRKRTGDALSTCLVMENGLNVTFPAAPPATVASSASLSSPGGAEAVLQSAGVSRKSVIFYFLLFDGRDHPVVYAGETRRGTADLP